MNYNILRTETFSKHFKKLAKKYPSAVNDYQQLLDDLQENPVMGKSLGKDCYKIRMTIKSKTGGKSGGARGNHLRENCAKKNYVVRYLR